MAMIHMVLLWLGSYADGASTPKKLPCGPDFVSYVAAHGLDPAAVLKGKGGGAEFGGTRRGRQPANVTVLALLDVSADGCRCGRDDFYRFELASEIQYEYNQHPADGYEVHVVSVHKLRAPAEVDYKIDIKHIGSGGICPISLKHPLFLPHWDRGASLRHRYVLHEAHAVLSGGGDPENIPLLCVPFPVAHLILQGAWQKLLLLVRWHHGIHAYGKNVHGKKRYLGPLPEWPPPGHPIWHFSNIHHRSEAPSKPISVSKIEEARTTLVSLAPIIEEHCPGEKMASLKRIVATLDAWHSGLKFAREGTTFRYEPQQLIDAVNLSLRLKGGSSKLPTVARGFEHGATTSTETTLLRCHR